MKRYYYAECQKIEEDDGDSQEIVQARKRLLKDFDAIQRLEQQVSIKPCIAWFFIHVLGALALGALLNMG